MIHTSTQVLVVIGLIALSLFLPTKANAFWPFDWLSGQVKGANTQSTEPHAGAFGGLLDKMLGKKDNNQNVGTTRPVITPPSPQDRLNQAVTNGRITQAQANEILSRLNAISAKEQELVALRKSLTYWFKTNNLSTALLSSDVGKKPTGIGDSHPARPSGRPSGTENRR